MQWSAGGEEEEETVHWQGQDRQTGAEVWLCAGMFSGICGRGGWEEDVGKVDIHHIHHPLHETVSMWAAPSVRNWNTLRCRKEHFRRSFILTAVRLYNASWRHESLGHLTPTVSTLPRATQTLYLHCPHFTHTQCTPTHIFILNTFINSTYTYIYLFIIYILPQPFTHNAYCVCLHTDYLQLTMCIMLLFSLISLFLNCCI